MLRILMFLIAAAMISCSGSFNSPKQYEYIANLHKEQFFMHVPEIMKLENFEVTENNEKDGILKFQKKIEINEKHNVEFNIEFSFNDSTRNVNSLVKAIIQKDKKSSIEYYNIQCYREEYKNYFINVLENIKNYCTKVSFPNPPGN